MNTRNAIHITKTTLLGFATLIIALSSIGCSTTTNTNATNAAGGNTSASPVASGAKAEDKGDFKLVFVPVKDEQYARFEGMAKESILIGGIVTELNADLALPVDIPLTFTECTGLPEAETTGVENAWYDPNTNGVTICYELMAKSERLFKDDETTDEKLREAVIGSTAWTLYHEIGHALIDVLKINLTGKNEDAADQISTTVLLDGSEAGEKAALAGGEDFYREAGEDNSMSDFQFADSHSLNKQRFYNIACWVYGTDPEKYSYLTEHYEGMAARASYCQDEYQSMVKSWMTHLGPYKKS